MSESSMATSSSASLPAYFELSWSILSTIGLANVFFGITVAGIANFPPIVLAPIIVSAAGAVANGLCYYAFYTDYYPVTNMAVASAFADITWLIQEAGLSFYSYIILTQVLERRDRVVFMILFWLLIAVITALRVVILIIRVQYIMDGSEDENMLSTVNSLHIGYFTSIALIECLSAVFLLRKFHWAQGSALNVNLFSYLMRSTEIRLALLALVGITRAVTYSFQTTAQSATHIASQLDRFAYTLECVFPVMMFIDILASRLVFANNSRNTDSYKHNGQSSHQGTRPAAEEDAIQLFTVASQGNEAHVEGGRNSSSDLDSGVNSVIERSVESPNGEMGGISKTVEFRIYETKQD